MTRMPDETDVPAGRDPAPPPGARDFHRCRRGRRCTWLKELYAQATAPSCARDLQPDRRMAGAAANPALTVRFTPRFV